MNKTIIKSLITISIFTALFVSCSGVNNRPAEDTSKDAITLTGSFSAPNASVARSATSSFALEGGDFELLAYQTEGTPIAGTIDAATSTWSVKLNKTGEWNIVINYKRNNVTLLTGSKTVNLESLTSEAAPTDCLITLASQNIENPTGSINLEIQNQTTTVAAISYVLTGSKLTDPLSDDLTFTDNKAVIDIDSLKEGIYELELCFKNSTDKLVYYCKEQLPVYGGYTTDTWYGDSPYFVTVAGITSFVITQDLLDSFIAVQNFPKDKTLFVLYDFNYNTDPDFPQEFANHTPGLRIVESITENQTLESGIELAKNTIVEDFVIDQETQAIYTLEYVDTNNGTLQKIVSYPSYAGYAYGKTIYSQTGDTIKSICFSDGYIYALLEGYDPELIKISQNGLVKRYSFFVGYDSEGDPIEYSGYRLNAFAIYGNYFYCAYGVEADDDDRKVVIQFDKFLFDEENSQLNLVTSLEQAYSNTELPCSSFEYYETYENNFTDMQIMQDPDDTSKINIYAVCTLEDYSPFITLGGLLKVSTEKASDGSLVLQNLGDKTVFGWYMADTLHSDADTNTNTWFYGPRKILAKKPDELVIVDEGTYSVDSSTKHKNRIVTVNLKELTMSVKNVNVSLGNAGIPGSAYIGKYRPDGNYGY